MAAVLVVSHSRRLAQGACELVGAMAKGVRLEWRGGDPPDLGVSVEMVSDALERLVHDAGEVVVVADLGSSVLAAEAAVELLGVGSQVRVLRGVPMLEGLIAAAMALVVGGGLADAEAAAEAACGALEGGR